jgi:TolB-like protein/DNA-binding winged helix-turn-helix (wHTH) protein
MRPISPHDAVVRFGVFEADLRSGDLRKNGVKVKLQELPFRALKLLLSRPDDVLSREEFRKALWPDDVFVDFDHGISSAINRLRDALGDSAENPIFIETVDRRGYRWIGPLRASAPATPTANSTERPLSVGSVGKDNDGAADATSGEMPDTPSFGDERSGQEFTARYLIGLKATGQKRRRRFGLWIGCAVGLLALAVVLAWIKMAPPAVASIAVLPFDNLGAASDDAFSDGLTDEVADSVSHLEGVRVTGRRSAYVFKGNHDDLHQVGARLNVDAVVEGSVQRSGDRTHVTVQLNRTRDGFTVWSQTYDGNSTDWIQIESQIASSIARALARKVSPEGPALAAPDPEARALYLEGRYLWNQRNFAAELKSVDLMQQAIARDPNYALAWAGLADSLAVIGNNEEVSPATYMPQAREAARKALLLDPSLAEAHAVLGMVACHYDYDWPAAEREYQTALRLNPSYASAHQYYALGLMAHGRFSEAREQLETARRLDPLALIVDVDVAVLLKFERNYDGVIAQSQRILQIDPNFQLGYSMLTTGYFCEHRWDDWRAADAKVPSASGGPFVRAVVSGNTEEARRIMNQHIAEVATGQTRPYDVAWNAVRLGDRELALEWLEKSYQNRDYWLLFLNVEPEMDRYDPILDFRRSCGVSESDRQQQINVAALPEELILDLRVDSRKQGLVSSWRRQ